MLLSHAWLYTDWRNCSDNVDKGSELNRDLRMEKYDHETTQLCSSNIALRSLELLLNAHILSRTHRNGYRLYPPSPPLKSHTPQIAANQDAIPKRLCQLLFRAPIALSWRGATGL